jgi:hypothetical protein
MHRQSPLEERWLGEINQWQVVEAHKVTRDIGDIAVWGEVLIGPHPVGGQAIIPPGIYSNTPTNRFDDPEQDPQLTDRGWRFGIWESVDKEALGVYHILGYPIRGDEENLVWVTGDERPISLPRLNLEKIARIVRTGAPEHEDFIKATSISVGGDLWAQTRPEIRDTKGPSIEKAHADLTELKLDATAVFGEQWTKQYLAFPQGKNGKGSD